MHHPISILNNFFDVIVPVSELQRLSPRKLSKWSKVEAISRTVSKGCTPSLSLMKKIREKMGKKEVSCTSPSTKDVNVGTSLHFSGL